MSEDRTSLETDAIENFLSEYFPDTYEHSSRGESKETLSATEESEIEEILDFVDTHFSRSKGVLGLALDFLMVAEQLSRFDEAIEEFNPNIDRDDIFDRFDRKNTSATLTFRHADQQYGIRPVHNDVIDLFRDQLGRTNFPSSPGHHTGEWERYDDLLERSFRLSRRGRYETAERLFEYGLEHLQTKSFARREPPFQHPFKRIVEDYERSHPEEQGGSAYQALAYGYVKAQWPHLSLRASKVRTGSSRQHRYGDIDGYLGPDLMISVEVKDLRIDDSNFQSQLGTMIQVAENTTAVAIAICQHVSDEARSVLEENGVRILDDDDLCTRVETWDYHKQNRAVQGMIHFFAHIEENPVGTQRLLSFLQDVDPENRALVHLEVHEGT